MTAMPPKQSEDTAVSAVGTRERDRFSGGAGDAVPGAGGVVTLPDRCGASDRILGVVLVERARQSTRIGAG